MELRKIARRIRDNHLVNPVVRYPFEALKKVGVPIPKRIYQHLGFSGVFTVTTREGCTFKMRSKGRVIENGMYWAGLDGYEPESLRTWVELASVSQVVLDIGANTGLYSLLAASVSPSAQIHAFEPLPDNIELLRGNSALNPSFKICVHEAAVGASAGTAELFIPSGPQALSASLSRDFRDKWSSSRIVERVAIDDVVKREGLTRVDLVKLDVEGYEEFALEGMKETLARFRPALMIELLPKTSARVVEQLKGLLATGYAFYRLTTEGVSRLDVVELPKQGRNALLSPPERLPPTLQLGQPFNRVRPLAS